MAYGFDRGRYGENKRAVKDKYMGPLIRTEMTRCIHCTRCIRFINEIAGVPDLGAVNRGEHMEITTFVEKAIGSELSGNLADVCPVGALLSKPYAFTARPWELRKTETIDVLDAVGSNIRVDTRGPEVMRVLPRVNEDINEEWISDKTRFAYDGLKRQRLDRPYVRKDGKLQPATWGEAFQAIAAKVKGVAGNRIAAIAGDLVDVESMLALKELLAGLGSANIDCRQDGAVFDTSARAGYLFNSGIAGIERADVILLVGTNPRWEGTIVNARIRKRYLMGGLKVAVVGEAKTLTYPYAHLGTGTDVLSQLADGSHAFADVLKGAKNPMIIVGAGAFARKDGLAVQAAARKIAETCNVVQDGWNGFNILHTAASRVGGLEIGFLPGQGGRDVAGILEGAGKGEIDVVYLLGADEIDTAKLGKAFVIYQGHHGDKGAHRADVILPGAAYTEKNAIYVNTEGRPQLARLATFPPGEAREDWKILRALSEQLGHKLPYDSLTQLRQRLVEVNPIFSKIGSVVPAAWAPFGTAGALDSAPIVSPVANFYMTDPISRASVTMARCTETLVNPGAEAAQERTGTNG